MSGRIRPRPVAFATVFILVSALGAFAAVQGSAGASPANQPAGLDHFLCYSAVTPGGFTVPGNLILKNQFSPNGFEPQVSTTGLVHCNPVQKTVGRKVFPISNPNAHRLCFPIKAPTQPTFTVKVQNQFGIADLITGQPGALCLPTWKSLTGPPNMTPNQPPGLDHSVCYPVQYADASRFVIPPRVLVQDQFAAAAVRVQIGAPVALCLPTTKIANGVAFPAKNPRAHLLCFASTKTPKKSPVFDENQFGTASLKINTTTVLCLPSFKTVIR